ncbi:MAG: signal peptide peptidase SppA, partial [Planctomycetes bacterium]|nr:signal peptide peptidase SppA [Planctomycetota bacterium]
MDTIPPEPRHSAPRPDEGRGHFSTGRSANLAVEFIRSFLVAGCATIIAPFLVTIAVAVVAYSLLAPGGGSARSPLESLVPGSANVRERVVREGDPDNIIALISIQGTIQGNGSPLDGDGSLAQVSDLLRYASDDDRVRVVILQIDSPGGGLTASDLLHHEVIRCREKGKPVLAWAGSMMASGGYYIAAGTDGIMASPTATVGSIGVILRHFQVEDLLNKLGIQADPIVSGHRKDIGSPFRAMTEEERRLLQEYIDAAHRRFVTIVAEGRPLDLEAVERLADGSIYTAEAAVANGLVDRIGYI